MITLQTELARIKGLSPNFIANLSKLGIRTARDILWHFPARYDDFSRILNISDLVVGQTTTISGVVRKVESRRTWKKRLVIVEAIISDESGGIRAIWFNQPYIAKILRIGMHANFAGKVSATDGELYLSNPTYESLRTMSEVKHTAGLIPVYPETKGLTSRGIRYLVKPLLRVLLPLTDFIPKEVIEFCRLPDLSSALKNIHFPDRLEEAEKAKERFAFEDLFLLQLNNARLRRALAKEKSLPIGYLAEDLAELLRVLPFELTHAQTRSLTEILSDIGAPHPMNRLLQGDVGSGKTVIAAIVSLLAARSGYQATFMAPTEVLARQHYQTIGRIFGAVLEKWGIEVGLLLGAFSNKEKALTTQKIADCSIKIVIGTHALIQEKVAFSKLDLVIVDEQHRFGVEQRASLSKSKAVGADAIGLDGQKALPHFLSMSATPIPRTLSLTLFGDLDLSIIDELPKGRKAIVTKVVAPENRNKAYAFVSDELRKGRQAFVICPRIEVGGEKLEAGKESNNQNFPISNLSPLISKNLEVKAVKAEYEKLSKKIFPDLRVAMMHGKLKSKDKEKVMKEFKEGLLDILVSTSVVEVGVDVPNATIMIIEGAEHFGLAQLYQFRGRIGRGEYQSYCLLFTESFGPVVKERLDALVNAKNGFELAELDLKIRGPGQFLGDKQTGIPDLAMNALNNIELIQMARDAANKILTEDSDLKKYQPLKERLVSFQKSLHLE